MLAVVLAATIGVGCTGDWNQDSIFFSPRMADERLAAQRNELRSAEEELGRLRGQTAIIKTRIEDAKRSARTERQQLQRYQAEVARLERSLNDMRASLTRTTTVDQRDAEVRDGLGRQVAEMQRTIDGMRADLLVLLENA